MVESTWHNLSLVLSILPDSCIYGLGHSLASGWGRGEGGGGKKECGGLRKGWMSG